jgi:NADH dehydrogenase
MMSQLPTLAVTGATGFVGREVVKQALEVGFPVRVVVRNAKSAPPGCASFRGNVIHASSLEGAFDGIQCVLHLVGIIHARGENTFERVHVEATRHVLDVAKRAGVKRYLHMSALGTRANARSRYHQTKWAAEELVRRSGLGWTIFRPSLIYGPGDKSINVLAKILRRLPFVPVLGSGNSKIQPISVENVAKCFVEAIRNDDSVGQTYDLCGPVAFTWNELYDKLLAFYGLSKPKLHLPLPVARAQATILEKLLRNPPFNRDQLIMTEEDNVGDAKRAQRDFFLEQETFEQGLARYLPR